MVSSAAGPATRLRSMRNTMKPICAIRLSVCAVLAFCALVLTTRADASSADVYRFYPQARVIAHVHLPDGAAGRVFFRQEGKTRYLYVQQRLRQGFTVVDVTKPGHPKLVNRVPLETRTVMGSGLVITETTYNQATENTSPAEGIRGDETVPESVHVLGISDPSRSRTVQTFDGVTSIVEDPARNLIYVVNGDGVWILPHQQGSRGHECGSSDAISPIPNCN
jgi:hypothetical protein